LYVAVIVAFPAARAVMSKVPCDCPIGIPIELGTVATAVLDDESASVELTNAFPDRPTVTDVTVPVLTARVAGVMPATTGFVGDPPLVSAMLIETNALKNELFA
jgi:hypothetical protein